MLPLTQYSGSCISRLLECLEPYRFGPVTLEQCARYNKDAEAPQNQAECIRRTQALFLQEVIARKWAKEGVTKCIEALPAEATEELRFLVDVPEKKRKEYKNDRVLYSACQKTQNSALVLHALDAACATKDPKLVDTAISNLSIEKGDVARAIVQKTKRAIFGIFTGREMLRDVAVSRRVLEVVGERVSPDQKAIWVNFKTLFEGYYRLADNLQDGIIPTAYSVSKKTEIEVERDLYEHIEKYMRGEGEWDDIPDELKREHAVTFACLFAKDRFNGEKQLADEDLQDFRKKVVKALDKETRDGIELILKADETVTKLICPIVKQEPKRLAKQLNKPGTQKAYSLVTEAVVEANPALYTHINRLYQTSRLDATWKAIPAELKSEYAITFACLLSTLKMKKSPITNILKDFYDTTVSSLSQENQEWIRAICKPTK